MNLSGVIKNGLSYKFCGKPSKELHVVLSLDRLPSAFRIWVQNCELAVCRWVSPKRTRSYPYARVYDILSLDAPKKVAIIPIVKDEGLHGDRDFLQWDTVALLSLLGVYVIPAYYCDAEKRLTREGKPKLSNQKFEKDYIFRKLEEVSIYRHDALHWNLKEFKEDNFVKLVEKAKECYKMLGEKLNIKVHSLDGLDRYYSEVKEGISKFIQSSRARAKRAQSRECKTKQPKELLTGNKVPIVLRNYLGGEYYFTIDELEIADSSISLIESKHSKTDTLPSVDDVKDGLIKIMLYKSIDELYFCEERVNSFKVVLKLTSSIGRAESIYYAIRTLKNKKNLPFYMSLLEEAEFNNFEVRYYGFG
ncbi:hypothetical protein [Thermocrinis sp.]